MLQVELVEQHGSERTIWRAARQCKRMRAHRLEPEEGRLEGLISGLIKAGHLTPFEFCSMVFWIRCPIFVERQILRHRTASICELSLRQEQEVSCHVCHPMDLGDIDSLNSAALRAYKSLIESGEHPESARYVLPLATETEMQICFDLRNLMHFLDLRLDKTAQEETRMVANKMEGIFSMCFPNVHKAWKK